MLLTVLALVGIYIQIAHSSTCCPYYCNQEDCESATGVDCRWLESPADDSLIVDGIQCRAEGWIEGIEAVPTCTEGVSCATITTATPITPAPITESTIETTTPAPTTSAPTTLATTSAPTTSAPTTSAPTTSAPTTSAPTTTVITSAPTTSAPTTSAPTTSAPTTSAPTTSAPTTSTPTTSAPTTSAPTTPAPTTSAPTTVAPTTSAPTTSAPTTTAAIGVAGPPGDVGEEIDNDKGECNKINQRNCWEDPGKYGEDHDYSPNSVSFNGVLWDASKDACCYSYTSVYTGNENCEGDSPTQSHLVLEIDCDEGDFELVDNPEYCSYGLDKSTCYYGIKLDTECEDECEYVICISYLYVEDTVCPVTEGWVEDKAGNAFSFDSLYGIPSCNDVVTMHHDVAVNAGIIQTQHAMMRYSPLPVSVMAMAVIVLCGAWLFFQNRNSTSEYKPIKDPQEANRYV